MNQSSLNEHFEGSVPDFSKHVNLIGLSGDTPPGEPGIMNVAITGEDAREYARQISDPTGPASAESASSDHQPENPPEPPEDIDPEDAREQLRLIKGGKNN